MFFFSIYIVLMEAVSIIENPHGGNLPYQPGDVFLSVIFSDSKEDKKSLTY